MGLILLAIAVVGTVSCIAEGGRAWGGPTALGIGVAGFVLTFLVPFGSVVAAVGSVLLFQKARTARLAKTMAELDASEADLLSGGGSDPAEDPWESPNTKQ